MINIHEFIDLTLVSISRQENENSKKLLPNKVMVYLPMEVQSFDNLAYDLTTVRGLEPLSHMILPCRLCLQVFKQSWYSSSRMEMAILSTLTHIIGIWLNGMLQTLFNTRANNLVLLSFFSSLFLLIGELTFVSGNKAWKCILNMLEFICYIFWS